MILGGLTVLAFCYIATVNMTMAVGASNGQFFMKMILDSLHLPNPIKKKILSFFRKINKHLIN